MNSTIFFGAALILLGGILQGTFAVPMKYANKWGHENIWLIFCLSGMVIFPWILTAGTVPSLAQVYSSASFRAVGTIVLFGLLWGVGATLTGIGLKLLGIGLGFAIILGLSASVGSLIPLLVLTPEKLFSKQGRFYLIGTLVMCVGMVAVAIAGVLRERLAAPKQDGKVRKTFAVGLLVCVASGILSSTLNFSYAFGGEVIENARRLGASDVWASNVVAAPATSGGFLANLIYCAYKMRQNRSLKFYWLPGTGTHWLFGLAMGASWYGGLALYGMGISRMGDFGTITGWPPGTIIISSNGAGLLTGEWAKAGSRTKTYLFVGSSIILIALIILSMAQRP